MVELNKKKMLEYAYTHALSPNSNYEYLGKRPDNIGDDCTNFISQILHHAGAPMRFSSPMWYYKNKNSYSISWSTSHSLFWFLRDNYAKNLMGPKGKLIPKEDIALGDLVFFIN